MSGITIFLTVIKEKRTPAIPGSVSVAVAKSPREKSDKKEKPVQTAIPYLYGKPYA